MKLKKVNNLVLAALFSALICVATVFLTVSTPIAGGYINIGDCFVFASIIILPAGYSMLSAGIGSALADIISGHAIYSPASFVIKALMALAAGLIYTKSKNAIISEKAIKHRKTRLIFSKLAAAFVAECIMCAGYFVYEALILGYGLSAIGNLFPNAVQGVTGIILSVVLATAFEKSKVISKFR